MLMYTNSQSKFQRLRLRNAKLLSADFGGHDAHLISGLGILLKAHSYTQNFKTTKQHFTNLAYLVLVKYGTVAIV